MAKWAHQNNEELEKVAHENLRKYLKTFKENLHRKFIYFLLAVN